MPSLATVAIVVGLVLIASRLPLIVAPDKARLWLKAFAHNRPAAWILVSLDFIWVGWNLYYMPMGRFDSLKPALWALVPVTIVLVGVFMDDLLAPRALGGLLLLLPSVILRAAFLHPEPLRLVMVVLAYLWVIAGVVLVLAPYRYNSVVGWLSVSPQRCRLKGIIGAAVGAVVLGLGVTVY